MKPSVEFVVIGNLVFSDGIFPQMGLNWNANNNLEMLRQFCDCTGQPQLSLIISHNGLGYIGASKKRSMIHQERSPFDGNLPNFPLSSCERSCPGRNEFLALRVIVWVNFKQFRWLAACGENFQTEGLLILQSFRTSLETPDLVAKISNPGDLAGIKHSMDVAACAADHFSLRRCGGRNQAFEAPKPPVPRSLGEIQGFDRCP